MSFILKLKALARDAGTFLRSRSATPGPAGKRGATDPAERRTAQYRGTAFVPHDATLNPALSGSDWRPSPLVQQQAWFSQQCTLQAVFDWYQDFLDGKIDERISDSSDDNSANDPGQSSSQRTEAKQVVPGFPQFARQIVDTEMDPIRVRFFHPGGREAGVLLLRPQADRCIIEVPGGSLFVVRETTVIADLTGDLSHANTGASPILES